MPELEDLSTYWMSYPPEQELIAMYLLGAENIPDLAGQPTEEETIETMRTVMATFGAAGAAGVFAPGAP